MIRKKVLSLIIVGVAAILAALVIIVINIAAANSFSEAGERALKYTVRLQNMMKSPSSFALYGDVLYISTTDDGEYLGAEYIYIDYTAQNSYGAALLGTAVFIDGEYYDRDYQGPSKDDYNMKTEIGRQQYMAALDELIKVSNARMALYDWELLRKLGIDNNENIEFFEIIPADKIASKLGIRAD